MLFGKKNRFKGLPRLKRRGKEPPPFYAGAEQLFLSSDSLPDPLRLRVHRSLSWLVESDKVAQASLDCQFITLWIAFNAAYGREMGPSESSGDRAGYKEFIGIVCSLDDEGLIGNALFTTFSQAVRVLLEDRFCYQPYWNAVNGRSSMASASDRFNEERRRAYQALQQGDHSRLLAIVVDRLYTIRNQVLHGGATCGSSVNRSVVKTGIGILRSVVPSFLVVMMKHPGDGWGAPYYPYSNNPGEEGWKA